jgi:hypothetical protein
MADEHATARYRHWYAKLLRFYPKPYRERFGEGMEQTFNDLCREHPTAGDGLFGFVLWVFVETSARIIRENMTFMIRQNTRRLIVWTIVGALILTIPLAMQFQPFADEVQWNEAIAYGVILLVVGGFYELWQWLKTRTSAYRFAFGVGLLGALLLGWVNGAVGIIGSEDNPANLMYGTVFSVGLIGSLISRFKPRGMARTLFAAALVQALVPVVALTISPEVSWGDAGVIGVFVFNSIFGVLFAGSGFLFLHVAHKENQNQELPLRCREAHPPKATT